MTFDRSGTADRHRLLLELSLQATHELDRMETRPSFVPLFRLWDYDPHRTWRSWLIQIPEEADPLLPDPIVLERTWDAAEDRDRLARDLRRRPRLLPTMCVREARLPKEELTFLREVGSRIAYSRLDLREAHTSLVTAQYGLEGFRKETVRLRSDRVRLEWGGNPSRELTAVATWASRMRSLCMGCFPGQDLSIVRAGPTGACALCRQPAPREIRACSECRALYHRECWEYVGRCAIYGCDGTSGSRE